MKIITRLLTTVRNTNLPKPSHVYRRSKALQHRQFCSAPEVCSTQPTSTSTAPTSHHHHQPQQSSSNYHQRIIKVTFPDGSDESFHVAWLRDSCRCPLCINSTTKDKRLNPADVDYEVLAPIKLINNGLSLTVHWVDGLSSEPHISTYDLAWLSSFKGHFNESLTDGPADEVYRSKLKWPDRVAWTSSTIEQIVNQKHDYNSIMSDDESLLKLVEDLIIYGISFINGAPRERKTVLQVARRIAYERITGYGSTFDVLVNPSPNAHFSYSSSPLDVHTDLCYRERVPGLQMLHCISSAASGGLSCFTDGLTVSYQLRTAHKKLFNLLTRPVPFTFYDSQRGVWFRSKWPVIVTQGIGPDGEVDVREINLSYFSMRAPLLPLNQIEDFFKAYKEFYSMARNIENQLQLKLNEGNIALFNNRRVFHGRTGYDASREGRFLQGCYMDWDEIDALYEKLSLQRIN